MKRLAGILFALSCILPTAAAGGLTVVDDLGRTVTLNRPAQRILTLSPHATELVVAAGVAARLVGIAPGPDPDGRLDAVARIGGPGPLDREALLALQPDLVIAWHSGNRAADLDWIDRTGIALYRSEPASLGAIADGIRNIGALADTRASAAAAADRFGQAIQTPCAGLSLQPVYVEIWTHPAMSVGGRHWINGVLQAAGFRNTLDQLDRGVFAIATEAALAQAHLPRVSTIRRHDGSPADRLADVLSRPGPRLAEAAELLCQQRLVGRPGR